MKKLIVNFLVSLLFKLLGNTHRNLYNIQYLFGASTMGHEGRKKRWEKSLARLWKDKDLLDYLYYQAESDKENIFRGKARRDLSRGARMRTLFLVYSAQRAYMRSTRPKGRDAQLKGEHQEDMQSLQKIYKETVDVGTVDIE